MGIQDSGPIHEPNRNVAAGGVAPQNVALAVTVEVARPSDLEVGGDISHARRVGVQDRGAVHFPNYNVAAGIAPRDVALAVSVELESPDDGQSGGLGFEEGAAVISKCRMMAGGAAPKDVAFAVTIEAAGPIIEPGGGHISTPRRVGIQDGGAVHFPDYDVAAGIAPGDVALAVGVEVMGIGGCPRPARGLIAPRLGEPKHPLLPPRDPQAAGGPAPGHRDPPQLPNHAT